MGPVARWPFLLYIKPIPLPKQATSGACVNKSLSKKKRWNRPCRLPLDGKFYLRMPDLLKKTCHKTYHVIAICTVKSVGL